MLLFCNLTNNNRALNKCQSWTAPGLLQVLWATCKDQRNFTEEAAAKQGFGGIFFPRSSSSKVERAGMTAEETVCAGHGGVCGAGRSWR